MSMTGLVTCFPTIRHLTLTIVATIVPLDEGREDGGSEHLATSPFMPVQSAAQVATSSSAAMESHLDKVSPLSRQGGCIDWIWAITTERGSL